MSPLVIVTNSPEFKAAMPTLLIPNVVSVMDKFTKSSLPVFVTIKRYSALDIKLANAAEATELASKNGPPSTLTSLRISISGVALHCTLAGSSSLTSTLLTTPVPVTVARFVFKPRVSSQRFGKKSVE